MRIESRSILASWSKACAQADATLRPVAVLETTAGYSLFPLTATDCGRIAGDHLANRAAYMLVAGELVKVTGVVKPAAPGTVRDAIRPTL